MMRIHLTREEEQIVKQELASGRFHTTEEVVAEALRALQDRRRSGAARPSAERREAVREMLTFVEKNRVRLDGISVKDLIHEGHRV